MPSSDALVHSFNLWPDSFSFAWGVKVHSRARSKNTYTHTLTHTRTVTKRRGRRRRRRRRSRKREWRKMKKRRERNKEKRKEREKKEAKEEVFPCAKKWFEGFLLLKTKKYILIYQCTHLFRLFYFYAGASKEGRIKRKKNKTKKHVCI